MSILSDEFLWHKLCLLVYFLGMCGCALLFLGTLGHLPQTSSGDHSEVQCVGGNCVFIKVCDHVCHLTQCSGCTSRVLGKGKTVGVY